MINKKKNTPGSIPNSSEKKSMVEEKSQRSVLKEPNHPYSITSRIRSIGNSKGVILSNRVIEEAGISPDADLIIHVSEGVIHIAEVKSPGDVNTDLSSWDGQFKNAIKKGNKSEADIWEGMQNRFDKEEWS